MWRITTVAWAAQQGLRLQGDFVECGCYQGTTARAVCDSLDFASTGRAYYLYDLFDPSYEGSGSMPPQGDDPLVHVQARFAGFPNVKIIKGDVVETVRQVAPERIAFMHLDLNSAPAETAVLEVLWERMSPGAVLILDDYGWAAYAVQKAAHDAWFGARGYRVLEMATGQGMVIR